MNWVVCGSSAVRFAILLSHATVPALAPDGYLLASISDRLEPIKLAYRLAARIAYGGYAAEIESFRGLSLVDRFWCPPVS